MRWDLHTWASPLNHSPLIVYIFYIYQLQVEATSRKRSAQVRRSIAISLLQKLLLGVLEPVIIMPPIEDEHIELLAIKLKHSSHQLDEGILHSPTPAAAVACRNRGIENGDIGNLHAQAVFGRRTVQRW